MGSDRLLVRELWRYPVKSMVGERVGSVAVGERGLHADRLWAVREVERGATSTARRLPALLQCSARYAEDPPAGAGPGKPAEAVITFPGGEELSTADPEGRRPADGPGRAQGGASPAAARRPTRPASARPS